jgi:hypothetical protein
MVSEVQLVFFGWELKIPKRKKEKGKSGKLRREKA